MEDSLTITEEELKRFFELNNQKKKIDQELKYLKNKFNQHLDETIGKGFKGEFERGNFKVQRQIRLSISYHEEDTVQKLEELNLADFIVTVRRPDTDKLESAIKLGLVEEKEFESCKKTKLTQAIVVKEAY